MNIIYIIFGTFFSIGGILFAIGKIHPHISVWKDMIPEEKEEVNIIHLSRNIGEVILLSGIIFLLKGFLPSFQTHWFTGAMVAWFIVAGVDVCFINKSKRYRNQ